MKKMSKVLALLLAVMMLVSMLQLVATTRPTKPLATTKLLEPTRTKPPLPLATMSLLSFSPKKALPLLCGSTMTPIMRKSLHCGTPSIPMFL